MRGPYLVRKSHSHGSWGLRPHLWMVKTVPRGWTSSSRSWVPPLLALLGVAGVVGTASTPRSDGKRARRLPHRPCRMFLRHRLSGVSRYTGSRLRTDGWTTGCRCRSCHPLAPLPMGPATVWLMGTARPRWTRQPGPLTNCGIAHSAWWGAYVIRWC